MSDQAKLRTLRAEDITKNGLTGEYKGTETFQGNFGEQVVHKIGDQKIYGTAVLNRLLSTVQPGTSVQVNYLGKKIIANGRTLKEFKVETK